MTHVDTTSDAYYRRLAELIEVSTRHLMSFAEDAKGTFSENLSVTLATYAGIGSAARCSAALLMGHANALRQGVQQAEIDHLVAAFRDHLVEIVKGAGAPITGDADRCQQH